MSNNRDFERKSQSLIDIGEFYSDNLVIFTETDEDRWERFKITNPVGTSALIEIFGVKNAKLIVPQVRDGLTDAKLVKILKEFPTKAKINSDSGRYFPTRLYNWTDE